jgi:branched-chain amino acid transport system substrate-binding protein
MKLKLTCLGLVFGLLAWSCGAGAQGAKIVRIGDISSYSSVPQLAEPYRNGWQLAVEQINAAGGINGARLEVILRDDGGKPDETLRQAQDLVVHEKVDVLAGSFLSGNALALADFAAHHKKPFLASAPLTDALTWDKGNRYTFRLRPSVYMQVAMLVEEAAKLPVRRWATLAPNYEYGQSAVMYFRMLLKAKRPDVEFVSDQWPALGKLDAVAIVQALTRAKPEAIFNATFGDDLGKFVHEGNLHALFSNNVTVVSLLAGEPETLEVLKHETPKGWIVTGYPWDQINTPAHSRFMDAYFKKYNTHPRLASVLGYSTVIGLAEAIRKARSTEPEAVVAALRGLTFDTPLGPVTFRAIDQQSTMGTYVGTLDQIDGAGLMTNWRYADGKNYLPDDAYVRTQRPASAMK